jgi:hypothetical protein
MISRCDNMQENCRNHDREAEAKDDSEYVHEAKGE